VDELRRRRSRQALLGRQVDGVSAGLDEPRASDPLGDPTAVAEADEIRDAVRAALADIEPLSDLHASADYRRRVAVSLAVRAITDAHAEARRAGEGAHAR
jgi:hypothetical protein